MKNKTLRIIHVSQFDSPLPLDEWKCSMMMCPSQCYYHTKRNGIDYVLYLRWRWDDPWQADIIKGAKSEDFKNCEWTHDVFAKNHVYFSHDEVSLAKEKLIEIFNNLEAQI